ncbi:MAG: 3-oxoacyl-[acyl-carrier-protein] reductase [Pirellulales bacterium]|nr:3-oxoacyl-[acyl-carrier-protein] reductase [Pirellulales bacterium]
MAKTTDVGVSADLSNQVALVTGASRGIGRTIAEALAACGAKVACVARNEERLQEVVESISSAGNVAQAWTCDVNDKDSIEKVVDRVAETWDRLDILVNNAGITQDTLLPRMSDEQWDDVVRTNLRSVFLFTRAATRHMMSQRYGRVINLSSVSGVVGNKGQSNYAATKAGIIGFTKSVALELAGRKVTANAVAPGFIETDMTAALGDALKDEAKKRIPCKRLGSSEDIAAAVVFLASSGAAYLTGQTLVVDGGMTLGP